MAGLLATDKDQNSWVKGLPEWPFLLFESLLALLLLLEQMVPGVLCQVARPRIPAVLV